MTMSPLCYVQKPGLFTTIQDLGRYGRQRKGIPPAGVMDYYAYTVANTLLGNDSQAAVLEMTMMGPTIRFNKDIVITITGGDLQPMINRQKVPMWRSFSVKKGDDLSFSGVKTGVRAYLAVDGGLTGEEVLGSKSTYVKAGMGGKAGRALQRGDALFQEKDPVLKKGGTRLDASLVPSYKEKTVLRVIEGPEEKEFTKQGLNTFYTTRYTVKNESDRMGCRLNGSPVTHLNKADILSDAVDFGTIQVAADGQPMILMADRQTTGGYTRVAAIITVDLPIVAQLLPGQKIAFKKVSLKEAQELLESERKQLSNLAFAMENMLT